MDVKIKDREQEVSLLKFALNMVDISINYLTADLIHQTLSKVNELGDQFSLKDAAKLEAEHEEKWATYFKKQKSQNQ